MIPCLALGLGTLLALGGGSPQAEKSVDAHARALRLLEQGDARGAEAAAREALAASARFAPEEEITEAPEKGLLFDDMIAEARAKYRRRRGNYFLTLGEALTRQERWMEARKALQRASQLSTSARPHLVTASHPDLDPSERVDALLSALFAIETDRAAVEKSLLESGVFPDRNTLQAVIDQRRLMKEVSPDYPDLEMRVDWMPEVRSATDRGTFVSTDYLSTGAFLVLYFPADGCGHCSEELDGIDRAVGDARKEGKPVTLAAFVKEADLGAARRIARLLALPMEVGRVDRLPEGVLPPPEGEVRIVTRNGLLQVVLNLAGRRRGDEIRGALHAVLSRLESFEEGELTAPDRALQETAELESGGRSREALLDAVELARRREGGPGSKQSLYGLVDRASRSLVAGGSGAAEVFEFLELLSGLRGAGAAKSTWLSALDPAYERKLLEAVQRLEKGVERQAGSDQGVFLLAVARGSEPGEGRIYLERSFPDGTETRNFGFVLKSTSAGLEVLSVVRETASPLGFRMTSAGPVVLFETADGCRGLRRIGDDGPDYEACPARILRGEIVEEHRALVDALPRSVEPLFYRRGRIDGGTLQAEETPLERGLRLFEQEQYADAVQAFEEAGRGIDPLAPYDDVDLRYNTARSLEGQGRVREALALFETIGDVSYQDMVEDRISVLARGGRQ